MTTIKRQWMKNLSEEQQIELLKARHERDRLAGNEYARANKVKIAARKYGIATEVLEEMIASANGICQLCTRPLGESLNVDHCHSTDRVRGVLCQSCNNGLGQFRDDIEVMQKAVKYLIRHSV